MSEYHEALQELLDLACTCDVMNGFSCGAHEVAARVHVRMKELADREHKRFEQFKRMRRAVKDLNRSVLLHKRTNDMLMKAVKKAKANAGT